LRYPGGLLLDNLNSLNLEVIKKKEKKALKEYKEKNLKKV